MHMAEYLAVGYALCSAHGDSITLNTSPNDTVEYQAEARYSGFNAGWLTLLKVDQQYWIPLKQWLDQSGFSYAQYSGNKSEFRLNPYKPMDARVKRCIIGGYSPVHPTFWRLCEGENKSPQNRHRHMDSFIDQEQIAWVNDRWIKKQFGMTLQFREQALEVDFDGTTVAPVREWYDFHTRWGKEISTKTTLRSRIDEPLWRPKMPGRAFEISTWSGNYQISLQQGIINSSILWDAVGHAGNAGLRLFGSAKAFVLGSGNLLSDESGNEVASNHARIEWPGLELQWAWGLQDQLNLLISPASLSDPWKISGSNSLMSKLIGFDVPTGIHARRWNPPDGINEWSLNQGSSRFLLHRSHHSERANVLWPFIKEAQTIPVDLLPGTNRIDYRIKNAWGGISNRCLIWNIPGMMIPQGRWNYRYEISAPLRVSGMLGYGWRSNLSLQTEAAVNSFRDSKKSPEWVAKGSALWTVGRFWFGHSEFALTNMHQQWKQQIQLQWNQSLQGSVQYQNTRRVSSRNTISAQDPARQYHPRMDDNLFGLGPIGETLDISGQWVLPRGYGLRMLRLEYELKNSGQPAPEQENYRAILQFEGWGQQWQYQLPRRSLSLQGRIRSRSSSLTLIYQTLVHQKGWQAWTQCHLRGGHHLGLSYSAANQVPWPWPTTAKHNSRSWTLEWKWIGLQSSRSARAQINSESRNIEYKGQFTLSGSNNTFPIKPVNGLALLHLEFYGDQNANGIKDDNELSLDATGCFEAPAGVPYQILTSGAVLLGPFPNHSRVRLQLTPQHMRDPGWITDRHIMEIASLPNSTAAYTIGLLRSRQITGIIEFVPDLVFLRGSFLPQNAGGIRIHACLLSPESRTDGELDAGRRPYSNTLLHSQSPDSSSIEAVVNHQTLSLSDGYFELNDLMPGIYKVWADTSPFDCCGHQVPRNERILDLRQMESIEIHFRIGSPKD
jgi:hypothetical protein